LKIGLDGCKDVSGVANVQVTVMPTSKENVIQSMISKPSVSQLLGLIVLSHGACQGFK
jgi:hypothetical protein